MCDQITPPTGCFSKGSFFYQSESPSAEKKCSGKLFLSTEPGRGEELFARNSFSPTFFQRSNGPAVEKNCLVPLESTCARNPGFLLVCVSKRGPKTPKNPARFARRNVGFTSVFKLFASKGGPKTSKNPARFARRNVDFTSVFKLLLQKGVPKP